MSHPSLLDSRCCQASHSTSSYLSMPLSSLTPPQLNKISPTFWEPSIFCSCSCKAIDGCFVHMRRDPAEQDSVSEELDLPRRYLRTKCCVWLAAANLEPPHALTSWLLHNPGNRALDRPGRRYLVKQPLHCKRRASYKRYVLAATNGCFCLVSLHISS